MDENNKIVRKNRFRLTVTKATYIVRIFINKAENIREIKKFVIQHKGSYLQYPREKIDRMHLLSLCTCMPR